MTIFRDNNDGKLYTVRIGNCGKYTGDILTIHPYNHKGQVREIRKSYFDKYIIPVGER